MIATSFLIKNALGRLLLPPGCNLLIGLLLLVLWRRKPRLARVVLASNLLALWLLSTPWLSVVLRQQIEPAPITANALAHADAIVVLGGGTRFGAREMADGRDVNDASLERVRYAARLARQSGLPVALTGGRVYGEKVAESELMARSLADDFGLHAQWIESAAVDTGDNASLTAQALLPAHPRIVLVSSAFHLRRAIPLFERAGFSVIPAATGYMSDPPFSVLALLPDAEALASSFWTLHEWLGSAWYRRGA